MDFHCQCNIVLIPFQTVSLVYKLTYQRNKVQEICFFFAEMLFKQVSPKYWKPVFILICFDGRERLTLERFSFKSFQGMQDSGELFTFLLVVGGSGSRLKRRMSFSEKGMHAMS